jgi:hypothetical protein
MVFAKSLTCPEQGKRACHLTMSDLGFCMRNRLIYSEQLSAITEESKNELK